MISDGAMTRDIAAMNRALEDASNDNTGPVVKKHLDNTGPVVKKHLYFVLPGRVWAP